MEWGATQGDMEPLRRLLGDGAQANGAVDDLQSICSPSVRPAIPLAPFNRTAPLRILSRSSHHATLLPPPPSQRLMKMVGDWGRSMLPPEEVTVQGRRFQVQQQLGEGGFSYVFLAREVPDSRGVDVALKRMLIHEREQEDDALREMETMRRLDHPNLLPLILGEIEDEPHPPSTSYVIASPARTRPQGGAGGPRRCHMVFPAYPEGTALDRCVSRPVAKAFTPTQLLGIGVQLCRGLEHVHALGIAHYDVKPGNVLLESVMDHGAERVGGYRAVLMDFGSSRIRTRAVRTRQEALRVQELAERESTAPFRAPELWDCPSDAVVDGAACDVWSLGCALFSLTAGGRSPFESATGETGGSLALAVLSGRYRWGESAEKAYETETRAAIDGLLSREASKRPDTVAARLALERAMTSASAERGATSSTVARE